MPRYYFDIRDKTGQTHDEVGEEFADETAAVNEALKVATSIARDVITADGTLVVSIRTGDRKLLDMTLTVSIDRDRD